MSELYDKTYNPDVLSCLANLSNDEVFTPPEVANQMLDMLPKEIWSDPDATFLDPACKSGVFLREIAKRLIKGLENEMPDLDERLEHIFKKQLHGVAITELTSLLSRRSTYCSKYPNSRYSVVLFDNPEGGIRFKRCEHDWRAGRCRHCGASQRELDRDSSLETYAYEFIHNANPKEMLPMKFDVIIGNPPYHLDTGGSGRQAKPIYNLFVEQAKKLNPRYLAMIIPSRWFAGGMGLESFRNEMMNDPHITTIVDYANAKECFPQNSVSGGVCYFLRERDNVKPCTFVNMRSGMRISSQRDLSEFPVLVRYNEAVSVIHKIRSLKESTMDLFVSSISPFGLPTSIRGDSAPSSKKQVRVLSSKGFGYLSEGEVERGEEYRTGFKVALSQTGAEHACEPDKLGKFRVLTSSMQVLEPKDVCTHSYLIVGPFGSGERVEAENVLCYLRTKFVRFLVLQAVSSIHISKQTFCFVPTQDFAKQWTDEALYAKYNLDHEEINFIESLIKPMDGSLNE